MRCVVPHGAADAYSFSQLNQIDVGWGPKAVIMLRPSRKKTIFPPCRTKMHRGIFRYKTLVVFFGVELGVLYMTHD